MVINPNQFGMDEFDLEDAFGKQEANLCSADLREFIRDNRLDLNQDGKFNPRNIFGSRRDMDHIYNTPRAWFMGRYLTPESHRWEGADAEYTPESDNIPWSLRPDRKVAAEDVQYMLSGHYQGTDYDPYTNRDTGKRGMYRSIGINRTGVPGHGLRSLYQPGYRKTGDVPLHRHQSHRGDHDLSDPAGCAGKTEGH